MGKTFSELLKAKRQIKELEAQLEPIPPPKVVGRITKNKLRGLIAEVFPQLSLEDVFIGRSEYDLITVAEMERFLARDGTDRMEYGEDFPKCIDFTRRLLGNMTIPGWWSIPKGDIWIYTPTWGHSVVIAALCDNESDLNKGIYLIEGQNDVIETAPEMFEDFKVRLIKI